MQKCWTIYFVVIAFLFATLAFQLKSPPNGNNWTCNLTKRFVSMNVGWWFHIHLYVWCIWHKITGFEFSECLPNCLLSSGCLLYMPHSMIVAIVCEKCWRCCTFTYIHTSMNMLQQHKHFFKFMRFPEIFAICKLTKEGGDHAASTFSYFFQSNNATTIMANCCLKI